MSDFNTQAAEELFNGPQSTGVRAGPGQAILPHSVAERERRRRITANLKSLHELVPHGNKTDKASMLDEIIDYIKLLQMQIKVLSASKIGRVDSVGPPSANDAAQASAALVQPGSTLFKERRDFENAILTYMQRDMNGFTEYLQSKGLDLIPVAQATTISNQVRNPGFGFSVSDSIDKQNRGKRPETGTSCSAVLVSATETINSDLLLNRNELIRRGKEVATDKSNGADYMMKE